MIGYYLTARLICFSLLLSGRQMTDVCQNTQDWAKAIDDANKCISIKPDWGKGYGRKGAALHGAGDLEGALKAYKDGLAVEPGASQSDHLQNMHCDVHGCASDGV